MMTEDEIYSLIYQEEENLRNYLRSGQSEKAVRSQAYIDALGPMHPESTVTSSNPVFGLGVRTTSKHLSKLS